MSMTISNINLSKIMILYDYYIYNIGMDVAIIPHLYIILGTSLKGPISIYLLVPYLI